MASSKLAASLDIDGDDGVATICVFTFFSCCDCNTLVTVKTVCEIEINKNKN